MSFGKYDIGASTTEEEDEASSHRDLLSPGEYDFTVLECEELFSKNDKHLMFKLTLDVSNVYVWDYLHVYTEADHHFEKPWWKIQWKKFMESLGGKIDENGNPSISNAVGKSGRVKIDVEKDDQYGDKNKVAWYIQASNDTPKYNSKKKGRLDVKIPDADDIPF